MFLCLEVLSLFLTHFYEGWIDQGKKVPSSEFASLAAQYRSVVCMHIPRCIDIIIAIALQRTREEISVSTSDHNDCVVFIDLFITLSLLVHDVCRMVRKRKDGK